MPTVEGAIQLYVSAEVSARPSPSSGPMSRAHASHWAAFRLRQSGLRRPEEPMRKQLASQSALIPHQGHLCSRLGT